MLKTLANKDVEKIIEDAVTKTGLFKRRLINVARKAGALSKFADFSNVTLGRLMKSFENTAVYEEALKDTYRLDLDVEGTIDLLKKMADGEIEVVVLDTKGQLTPLGKMAVEGISMKTDIVPPEKMDRIILESAKARLYSETRVLACHGKHDWVDSQRVKDLPEKLVCPICGSTEIARLRPGHRGGPGASRPGEKPKLEGESPSGGRGARTYRSSSPCTGAAQPS